MTGPAAVSGPDPSAPIGVFDSGIGGLTVVHELMQRLPRESIIYFGDSARVPYGPKSPETVRRYSHEIAAWLLGQGVKAIVIACNTATAHALASLRETAGVPVLGVVEPGARAAVAASARGEIGVIGTLGTVRSGAYERAIKAIAPASHVIAQACPLLVPFVEEGWLDRRATRLVVEEYLAPLVAAGVDAVVLGCTHYPLLKPLIGEVVGRDVRLIDSAEETAAEMGRVLDDLGLRNESGAAPVYRFIASDAPEQFLRVGGRFLGEAIQHVETVALG